MGLFEEKGGVVNFSFLLTVRGSEDGRAKVTPSAAGFSKLAVTEEAVLWGRLGEVTLAATLELKSDRLGRTHLHDDFSIIKHNLDLSSELDNK